MPETMIARWDALDHSSFQLWQQGPGRTPCEGRRGHPPCWRAGECAQEGLACPTFVAYIENPRGSRSRAPAPGQASKELMLRLMEDEG
jgi:hypothetical protein